MKPPPPKLRPCWHRRRSAAYHPQSASSEERVYRGFLFRYRELLYYRNALGSAHPLTYNSARLCLVGIWSLVVGLIVWGHKNCRVHGAKTQAAIATHSSCTPLLCLLLGTIEISIASVVRRLQMFSDPCKELWINDISVGFWSRRTGRNFKALANTDPSYSLVRNRSICPLDHVLLSLCSPKQNAKALLQLLLTASVGSSILVKRSVTEFQPMLVSLSNPRLWNAWSPCEVHTS